MLIVKLLHIGDRHSPNHVHSKHQDAILFIEAESGLPEREEKDVDVTCAENCCSMVTPTVKTEILTGRQTNILSNGILIR